jgi:hypothetical protein
MPGGAKAMTQMGLVLEGGGIYNDTLQYIIEQKKRNGFCYSTS